MKEEKVTATMFLLVALAGLCFLLVIILEIKSGLDGIKRVERLLESAGRMKYLLKYSPLQQWVVVLFGGSLVFTGLTVLAWTYQKRL